MDELYTQFRAYVGPLEILTTSELNTSEKLVLVVLHSFSNPHKAEAWPARAKIAKMASMSERNVKRILSSLEKKGWIVRTERYELHGNSKRQTTNLYTLRVPTQTAQTAQQEDGGTICPPGGDILSPGGGQYVPQTYKRNIPREKRRKEGTPPSAAAAEIRASIEKYGKKAKVNEISGDPIYATVFSNEIAFIAQKENARIWEIKKAFEVWEQRVAEYELRRGQAYRVQCPDRFFADCLRFVRAAGTAALDNVAET